MSVEREDSILCMVANVRFFGGRALGVIARAKSDGFVGLARNGLLALRKALAETDKEAREMLASIPSQEQGGPPG